MSCMQKILRSKSGLMGHIFRSHTDKGKEIQEKATKRSANMIRTGERLAPSGWKLSPETKEKLSKATEGKRHFIHYTL